MRVPEALDRTILSRADGVDAEILHEKAATLERLGTRLEKALARLRAYEESGGAAGAHVREPLLEEAAEALWYYVVQREVCGLRAAEGLLGELGVPAEVHLRMGMPRKGSHPLSSRRVK